MPKIPVWEPIINSGKNQSYVVFAGILFIIATLATIAGQLLLAPIFEAPERSEKTMPKHENIDQYIGDCAAPVAALLKELRTFINTALPSATEAMQYGVPVFHNANDVPVIYLFGAKDHVNFGFLKSSELSDPQAFLEGSGKPSKHIKIFPGQPMDKPALGKFIKQCEAITP